MGNNAYEGASELILGTRGTLYLTSSKGLLFQEENDSAAAGKTGGATEAAASVTAGKTLKLSNDPWAFRGKPIEIDLAEGNDTRDELVSFLDHVVRQDPHTIADVRVALADCATVLIANQSAETRRLGRFSDSPARHLNYCLAYPGDNPMRRRDFLSIAASGTAYSLIVRVDEPAAAAAGQSAGLAERSADEIRAELTRIAPPGDLPVSAAERNMKRVDLACDVLVAGGGLAGVCAAVAAARGTGPRWCWCKIARGWGAIRRARSRCTSSAPTATAAGPAGAKGV